MLEEAQAVLLAWAQAWRDDAEPPLPALPPVAFSISCTQVELYGELPQAADYCTAPPCSGDPNELFAKLTVMPGEKVAKVKMGLRGAVRDGMMVNLLLGVIPDLQLWLDANRTWTPLKAQQFTKYVNPAHRQCIASLEEPCKTREDSWTSSRKTGITIVWDESLRKVDFRFVTEPGMRAAVIKPTLTGSVQRVQQQVAAAYALGLSMVISLSIESSPGLTQLARVTA